jgi:hypothetical protein
VLARARARVCVCVCERERERESVCVWEGGGGGGERCGGVHAPHRSTDGNGATADHALYHELENSAISNHRQRVCNFGGRGSGPSGAFVLPTRHSNVELDCQVLEEIELFHVLNHFIHLLDRHGAADGALKLNNCPFARQIPPNEALHFQNLDDLLVCVLNALDLGLCKLPL